MELEKTLNELKDLLSEKKFSKEAVASMTDTFSYLCSGSAVAAAPAAINEAFFSYYKNKAYKAKLKPALRI